MMKVLSLFLLVFTLALHPVFSQDLATTEISGNGDEKVSGNGDEKTKAAEAKAEEKNEEPEISAAEQADRDLLVPRAIQEQLAAENAKKPITYGPAHYRKPAARKYSSKKRKTTYRKPAAKAPVRR
ncbi:MAG TPA: hypothetical protein VK927_04790 [Adhaeribacter sp.]|nr:hypothetical protein [Adhaeribacter sp.]